MRTNFKTVFSTALAILLLVGLLHLLVANFVPRLDQNMTFAVACIFLIPISLYYWTGHGGEKLGISSTSQWLGVCLAGVVFAAISFVMDCGAGFLFHSGGSSCVAGMHGLGFMFTLVGGGVAVMTGVGAIRAGLIKWLG